MEILIFMASYEDIRSVTDTFAGVNIVPPHFAGLACMHGSPLLVALLLPCNHIIPDALTPPASSVAARPRTVRHQPSAAASL
jgi:hypothetical protein